jgi:hypothetical protein
MANVCANSNPVIRTEVPQAIVTLFKMHQNKISEGKQETGAKLDDIKSKVQFDNMGQTKLRHGDTEIRFEQNEPFPLFPGEQLVGDMTPLEVVQLVQCANDGNVSKRANSALKLRANRDFEDKFGVPASSPPVKRSAGSEWLFEGPATYIPQVEVNIVERVCELVLLIAYQSQITAVIVKPNQV